jgi:hypothetical protein
MSNDCLSFGYSFGLIVRYWFYTLHIFFSFFAIHSEIHSIQSIFYSFGGLFLIVETKKTSSFEGRFAFIVVFYSKISSFLDEKHTQRPYILKGNLLLNDTLIYYLVLSFLLYLVAKVIVFLKWTTTTSFLCI